MIADQYIDAAQAGRIYSSMTGDAVIDGDDEIGCGILKGGDQCTAQAIAMHRTVGYPKVNLRSAQHSKTANGHGGSGCSVAVEVAHDHDPALFGNRRGQQFTGAIDTAQRRWCRQPGQSMIHFVESVNSARTQYAAQHWMHAVGPLCAWRLNVPAADSTGVQCAARYVSPPAPAMRTTHHKPFSTCELYEDLDELAAPECAVERSQPVFLEDSIAYLVQVEQQ